MLLGGKDGSREPILDEESSHMMDFVTPREGQTLDDNNWAY